MRRRALHGRQFVREIRRGHPRRCRSRVPEPDAPRSPWLRPVASPMPAAALKPRAFVKAWTLPELEAALDKLKDRQPDLARGKELYTQAQCAQCHLFRDAGGNVGPDLTAVAQRFGRHDILEAITDPSKVVSEQYAMVTLTVLDGKGGTTRGERPREGGNQRDHHAPHRPARREDVEPLQERRW